MTKKAFLLLPVLLLSVFTLTGCVTTRNIQGKPIMSTKVDKIINGVTTLSQIVSMFGPPHSTSKNPLTPGEVTYKYRFYYHKYVHMGGEILTSSTRKYGQKLDVVIKNGTVIAHSFTTRGNTSLKKILKKHKIHD
ncbi:MAG: hypothetical protein M1458_02905 [Deltaproteobacteria bacterium]|nr:hypothetical protein [Deltaproteobacteria bacterium]